jgi:hypothetical protein
MAEIRKRLVTDEQGRPVAVQIDYVDWLRIEKLLPPELPSIPPPQDLSSHYGVITLSEEPLSFQERLRSEWS